MADRGRKSRRDNIELFQKTQKIKADITDRLVSRVDSWGMTQAKAGQVLGLHAAEVGKLLRGSLDPSLERLMILCEKAGMSISLVVDDSFLEVF